MVRIYTKTGDQGETSLYGGRRVPKGHIRLEVVGTLDETNTVIGLALSEIKTADVQEPVSFAQHVLFDIGAEVAQGGRQPGRTTAAYRVDPLKVAKLERWIDIFDKRLPPLNSFILPGGSVTGARLHLARAVCRRAERALVRLHNEELVNPASLMFINRLSDLLYVLSRTVNRRAQVPEQTWPKSH